jgi:ring-1,2-phenylacetyl-CoA epoxidase subunit PaaD
MKQKTVTEKEIWRALAAVKDPEIPVVNVVEMGIVRDVAITDEGVIVKMTPTFSGCPALDVMRREMKAKVQEMGVASVKVEMVLHPPWSSDWITNEARQKLRDFGFTPPPRHGGDVASVAFLDAAVCPRCGSTNTILKNSFGATLCRTIWYCNECQDAFDQFKPL